MFFKKMAQAEVNAFLATLYEMKIISGYDRDPIEPFPCHFHVAVEEGSRHGTIQCDKTEHFRPIKCQGYGKLARWFSPRERDLRHAKAQQDLVGLNQTCRDHNFPILRLSPTLSSKQREKAIRTFIDHLKVEPNDTFFYMFQGREYPDLKVDPFEGAPALAPAAAKISPQQIDDLFRDVIPP